MTMLEEGINYVSIPSTENNISKSLPYEEEVKMHTAKNVLKVP
jgi:hypothetical protein